MSRHAQSDDSMRERILHATFKVLCRHGYGKLNLSDVAAAAGISRPTLYKSFASKDDLLTAFGSFEVKLLRGELDRATAGRTGRERVDALLAFLVDFYGAYQMRSLIEIEPGLVLEQMTKSLPVLVGLIAPILEGQVGDHEAVAMTLVRLSLCHYVIPGYDSTRLLDQLRAAVGRG